MTELVRNPDVMSKAKQELEQMISKGNNPIEEADIYIYRHFATTKYDR